MHFLNVNLEVGRQYCIYYGVDYYLILWGSDVGHVLLAIFLIFLKYKYYFRSITMTKFYFFKFHHIF